MADSLPLTLLILTFLDNFDTTRGLAKLARAPSSKGSSEEDEKDKQKARQQIGD